MGKEFGADPDTRIPDAQLRVDLALIQFDGHPATVWSELYRIGQKIPDDLLQPVGISIDDSVERPQGHLHLDVFGINRRTNRLDSSLNDPLQIDGLHIQSQLAADDAGHVEQILDDLRLGLRVAFDQIQRSVEDSWLLGFGPQHIHGAEYWC